jgi:siderophore ferric iron reductase
MTPSTSLHAGIAPEAARMPTAAVQTLQPVMDCLQHALPGIPIRVGTPLSGQILACETPQQPVRELVAYLRHAHPEAGPHYWSVRAYSLLVWQPAYAAVLSVHLAGALPQLQGMGQECRHGFVYGLTLPPALPCRARPEDMIPKAGKMVMQIAQTLARSLAHEISIHPKLAARLLADYIMAALLMVQQQRPELSNVAIRDRSREWLEAASLQGCSGVIPVRLDDGRERLALERRACCQHFRRHDGGLCSTCPKLKPEDRLAMLRQELARPAGPA